MNKKQFIINLFNTCLIIISLIIITGNTAGAQPELERKQQLLDLEKKLNELNSSLAQVNSTEKTNLKNTVPKEQGKDENAANDNNVKKQNETGAAEQIKEKADLNRRNKEEKNINEKDNSSKIKTDTDKNKENEEYKKEKKKSDWIIRTIDNGTHKDRKYAINLILSIKDAGLKKQLEKKIIDIIHDEIDLDVKVKAITVAGELKCKDAVPDLLQSLNSESKDIIIAAVYAIKKIDDRSTKPALIEKLKQQKLDANSNIIEALIDTLGEFKAVELITFAENAIKDIKTNQIIRELLVLFLGKLESKDSKNILVEILKDEDESIQIRSYAANSLANLGIKEAGKDIEKIINTIEAFPFNKKKKYYNLYIYCVAALAKLGDENAIPRLINALRSDNAVVRLKAVTLIKELKDKRTIDILKYKRDYDPSPKVQKAAKDALIELGVESEDSKDSESKTPNNDEKSDID